MLESTLSKDNFLKKSLKLSCLNFNKDKNKKIKFNFAKKFKRTFISFKIEDKDNKYFSKKLLNEKKCKFIDIEHQYYGSLKKKIVPINCYPAKKSDLKEIENIAKKTLIINRFYLDRRIKRERAENIKKMWLLNFFKKKRGDFLVIKRDSKKKIVGFLLIIKKNNKMIIDLIAVSKNYLGKGVAIELISFAEQSYFLKKTKIFAGTTKKNIKANRFYIKIGLKLKLKKHVYHYLNYEK